MLDSFQNLHTLNSAGYSSEPLLTLVPWYHRGEYRIFIIIFLLFSISGLRVLLGECRIIPAWRSSAVTKAQNLSTPLACITTNAEIQTDWVSAKALRHTYLLLLVGQGVKLSKLAELVGYFSASTRVVYRSQSTWGKGNSCDEIDPIHLLFKE